MPLLGTKGAASAQGFGFTLASLGGPSWIGILSASGAGTSTDRGNAIAVASSGNIYITGITVISSIGKAYIAKYNSLGSLQWQRYFNNSTFESQFFSINLDSSENVYVHGYFTGTSSAVFLGVTKLNSSGTIQWSTKLGTNGVTTNYGFGGAITSTGASYGVGYSVPVENFNPIMVYYNSTGGVSWQKVLRYDGGGGWGHSATVDSSDNGYISYGSGVQGFAVFNSSGTNLSTSQYAYITLDQGYTNICVDSSGNIYLSGSATGGEQGLVAVKINSSNAVTWAKRTYSGSGNTYQGGGVAVDSSGNVYVCGSATIDGAPYKGIINKYNSSGILQWSQTLSSASAIFLKSIKILNSSLYVTGNIERTNNDIFSAVLPINGSKTGTYTVGGTSITYGSSGFTNGTSSCFRTGDGPWSSIANTSLTGSNSSFSAVSAGLTSSVTQL